MTPDKLRARVAEFMENNDLHDDGEHTCGYSHDLLGHNIESLCREMIGVGLERACAYYSNQIHHDMDDYPDKFVKWCREEAQRVKAT